MAVVSWYASTALHLNARMCDLTSVLSSLHQVSRGAGSSGFGTRSSSFTERAATDPPVYDEQEGILNRRQILGDVCLVEFRILYFYPS